MGKETFLIEEYKALRSEIEFLSSHSRVLESSIVLGTAAIYAWVAKERPADIEKFIWWVPVILSVLGSIREYGHKVRTFQIAEYIRQIEEYFQKDATPSGWEHFLVEKRKFKKNIALGLSTFVFWLIMLISTLILALFMTFSNDVPSIDRWLYRPDFV